MKKALYGILLLLLSGCFMYGIGDKDRTQWWLFTYGDYANGEGRKDPRVKEVTGVFNRVVKVAEKVSIYEPRLHVINSEGEPYALALPDGGIVISKKTLDICYKDVKPKEGNQRVAFILGHELAHLSNKDFMHREAFLALQKYGSDKAQKIISNQFNLSDPANAKECKLKELMADRMGVLYAVMAGYDIGTLFGKRNDFFSFWAEQTGVKSFYNSGSNYPSAAGRLEFVRSQLLAVIERVELFQAGVLIYQKGSLFDASALFTEFSRTYPAREVFNNIGACHFSIALKRLNLIDKDAYLRFRVSTTIDYSISAENISISHGHLMGGEDFQKDRLFSRHLNSAERYFNIALEKDPDNKTSRYNLSAALILKGLYASAQNQCDLILGKEPNDVSALNNKAIAFYYYGIKHNVETAQKAIQLLQKTNRDSPANIDVLYNLAAFKEKREHMAGAKQYWEKYLSLSPPRDIFYSYVCWKLQRKCPPVTAKRGKLPVIPEKLKLGETLHNVEKKLGKVKVIQCEIGGKERPEKKGIEEDYWLLDVKVVSKGNLRILVVDGVVEMIEMAFEPGKNVRDMLKKYGPPGNIVNHTAGNFYVYRHRGFSFKEINGRVQSYIWFVSIH
jgi:tetratricopeptide (TPR) repeat protein